MAQDVVVMNNSCHCLWCSLMVCVARFTLISTSLVHFVFVSLQRSQLVKYLAILPSQDLSKERESFVLQLEEAQEKVYVCTSRVLNAIACN